MQEPGWRIDIERALALNSVANCWGKLNDMARVVNFSSDETCDDSDQSDDDDENVTPPPKNSNRKTSPGTHTFFVKPFFKPIWFVKFWIYAVTVSVSLHPLQQQRPTSLLVGVALGVGLAVGAVAVAEGAGPGVVVGEGAGPLQLTRLPMHPWPEKRQSWSQRPPQDETLQQVCSQQNCLNILFCVWKMAIFLMSFCYAEPHSAASLFNAAPKGASDRYFGANSADFSLLTIFGGNLLQKPRKSVKLGQNLNLTP